MARASAELVRVLRATAARLRGEATYHWGHMGSCNCGHLAQTVTRLDPRAIHRAALERDGDWAAQAHEYCPDSGYRIDDIIAALLAIGLSIHDLANLERLCDPAVLARLGGPRRLRHSDRGDAARYLSAWADILEAELVEFAELAAVAA